MVPGLHEGHIELYTDIEFQLSKFQTYIAIKYHPVPVKQLQKLWIDVTWIHCFHYNDVIMSSMASQIWIVCLTVGSGADQRKHRSSMSLAFAKGIHRWLVDSPHKGPVTWKMFPFDDIMLIDFDVTKTKYIIMI